MKDNLNIEKLFKNKFENFEGNVNPQLWENISKGVSSNAAASSTIGLGVKALIVGISAMTVGVTVYFVGGFNQPLNQIVKVVESTTVPVKNNDFKTEDNKLNALPIALENDIEIKTVIIADDNDPLITENEAEIINKLSNSESHTISVNLNKSIQSTKSDLSKTGGQDANLDVTADVTNSVTSIEVDETQTTGVKSTSEVATNDKVSTEKIEVQIVPFGRVESGVTQNVFEYEFKANAENAEKITWSFGDGNVSFDENPIHVFMNVGSYNVNLLVVSKDGLEYKESQTIEIKSSASIDNIPNVCTPNGDRVNDEFFITTTDIEELTITISNRLGQTVFKSNDVNFTWNGTDMSGNLVDKAVYTYYIIAKGSDGAIFKIPGQLYVKY